VRTSFLKSCAHQAKSLAVFLFLFSAAPSLSRGRAPDQTSSSPNIRPELNLKALAGPLQDLTPEDRKVVDEAVRLIHDNRDADALTSLTNLTRTNSKNSTIRVLRAYALLELGNFTGALNDATIAENAGIPAPYKCWFLAQVAYLAGNKPLCRREIKHVTFDATYGPKAKQLQNTLNAQAKSK